MNPAQLEKRKRIMTRSIKLGHCVCDPNKPCPCPVFKEKNICECAGEREEIITGKINLTDHVRAVGCASKVPKKYLETVVNKLAGFKDSRVLIGTESSDDAGVIELEGSERVSIMTVDVFAPSVDDPYTFGMIAAANSLSDIYAMGGKAETALSIVGFPIYSLPEEAMTAMLQGGADKLSEAGVAAIGGHSINDSEIKCGYAVLGSAEKDRIISNCGAATGDMLVLTKPVGGGIVLFGKQVAQAGDEDVEEVITAMTALNRIAGESMGNFGVNAATDVTGFSLLGHLAEMARGSRKVIEIDFKAVPLFSAVERLAAADAFPGAVERNREASEEYIDYGDLSEAEQNILYSPETSGGLLVSLPSSQVPGYIAYLKDYGVNGWIIGKVGEDSATGRIILSGSKGLNTAAKVPAQHAVSPQEGCCCSSGSPAKVIPQSSCCNNAAPDDHSAESCCTAAISDDIVQGSCCKGNSPESAPPVALPPAASGAEFGQYMKSVNKDGAIKAKEKKLIALALSVSHKCEECVRVNAEAARKLGATDEEISEAAGLGISFGGASVNMFYNQLR